MKEPWQILLLLDNFEQIVNAAPLVAELLAAAPGLKVLITSRMALRLSGEREYAVPPLGLPPRPAHPQSPFPTTSEGAPTAPPLLSQRETSEAQRAGWSGGEGDLTQYEAVRLFIDRAQAVKADFAITNENAPAVAEICYRLDGLPLAIELAAARVKLFPPQALLARLDTRLKLLTGGARDLPARQQTIRNTIDWSYDLLDEGEKRLFARLGVFVGGWTLEAAETVCNGDDDLAIEVVDGIAALVDKSLLRQEERPGGEPRFIMLETIREYALERLEVSGEAEAIRRGHADYYLELAEEAESQSRGPKQVVWLERLEMERDNLRAALAWSERSSNVEVWLQLAGSLQWFWFLRGYLNEGRTWTEGALARSSGAVSALRAKVLHGAGRLVQGDDLAKTHALYEESLLLLRKLGDSRAIAELLNDMAWLAYLQGDSASRLARSSESLALYRELDDAWGIASASLSLAGAESDHGDLEHAQKHVEESLALFRQSGDIGGIGGALQSLGALARVRGDDERAVAFYEESLALFRRLGYRVGVLTQLDNLGYMAHRQGDLTRMESCFREGLVLSKEIGDKGDIAVHLGGLAGALGLTGRPELAARLLGAADALLLALGQTRDWIDSSDHDRIVAAVRDQLGEEAFAAAWAAGRAMTLEQAIAEALGEGDRASRS